MEEGNIMILTFLSRRVGLPTVNSYASKSMVDESTLRVSHMELSCK